MGLNEELKRFEAEFIAAASETPFIVFLCGPKLTANSPAAKFRTRIKERLETEGFEVILGEDDGLDNPRLKDIGINAQDSEVEFIRRFCNAVIIIADSVGAFCELGLFSWLVDAVLEGARDDLRFVPVAIDYEKVVESSSYSAELKGGEKRAEPNLAEAIRRRFLPLGGADELEPHPPVPVRDPPRFDR